MIDASFTDKATAKYNTTSTSVWSVEKIASCLLVVAWPACQCHLDHIVPWTRPLAYKNEWLCFPLALIDSD